MKLFYCYTDSQDRLRTQYFLPTLPLEFETHAFYCPAQGSGDYLTPDYVDCLHFKVHKILETLERHAGEVFVWSDIDILFFKNPIDDLQSLLEQSGKDVLFQREGPRIEYLNPGFLVCRATEELRGFYRRILGKMHRNPSLHDMFAANELIQKGDPVRWGYLPMRYYLRTHGWPPPRDTVIYHANFTSGRDAVGQKIRQFEEILWVRKWGYPALLWSCAKRAPGKVFRMVTGERKKL